MTAEQYLTKRIKICKQSEPLGCRNCPLDPYGCGVPVRYGDIAGCVKLVEDFKPAEGKKPIQDVGEIVYCKDCMYRGTPECSAKHERADLDFCSKGRRINSGAEKN